MELEMRLLQSYDRQAHIVSCSASIARCWAMADATAPKVFNRTRAEPLLGRYQGLHQMMGESHFVRF